MITWTATSSLLILIVLLLRTLLKGRISPRIQYALWALVLLRLLIPGTFFHSSVSVMNVVESRTATTAAQPSSVYGTAPESTTAASAGGTVPALSGTQISSADTGRAARLTIAQILTVPWLVGAAVVVVCFTVSNFRLGRELRQGRQRIAAENCPLPVYLSRNADTPLLFGIFRPAIYVTPKALESEEILSQVLEHELTHYRHGDNIWALLRCAAVALHWYNPLVWLAANVSLRDAELACDEGTIRRIGEDKRMEYGRTLIGFTVESRPMRQILNCATTMTGGKNTIKERITLIAKRPRTAVVTLAAVILIAAVAVGCTFMGAKDKTSQDTPPATPEVSAPEDDTWDVGGVLFSMPTEYYDEVTILSEDSGVAFYMKSQLEKYADTNMGWLFSIIKYSRAQYEEYLMSDGSGMSFFAVDDGGMDDRTYWTYYGFFVPTDVRFDMDAGERYPELQETLGRSVKESVMALNDLTVFSGDEGDYTYPGNHMTLLYYPYNDYNGTKDEIYTLTLSQPVKQGEGGIWCVERWSDGNYTYYWFIPYDGQSSQVHYKALQAAADSGEDTSLLDPLNAAKAFAAQCFYLYNDGREPTDPSFTTPGEYIAGLIGGDVNNIPALTTEKLASFLIFSDGAYSEGGAAELMNRLESTPADTIEVISGLKMGDREKICYLAGAEARNSGRQDIVKALAGLDLTDSGRQTVELIETYMNK